VTRKFNRICILLGAAGFSSLIFLPEVMAAIGYSNSDAIAVTNDILPYFLFLSFILLFWFGVLPAAGTAMYVRGYFDDPRYDKRVLSLRAYRFFFITDDQRFLSKERGRS
jgi:hypothetical protein